MVEIADIRLKPVDAAGASTLPPIEKAPNPDTCNAWKTLTQDVIGEHGGGGNSATVGPITFRYFPSVEGTRGNRFELSEIFIQLPIPHSLIDQQRIEYIARVFTPVDGSAPNGAFFHPSERYGHVSGAGYRAIPETDWMTEGNFVQSMIDAARNSGQLVPELSPDIPPVEQARQLIAQVKPTPVASIAA